jgi:cephalosporin hydroxylase
MSDPIEEFKSQVNLNIQHLGTDKDLQGLSNIWIRETSRLRYTYNFSWMGRPIIQFPQDVFAMQEIIWSVKPDLIIETGIAHGGSLIFYASMLELNAACDGPRNAGVLGIDIDIRAHNRNAIENHPMFKRITMLEGSSIDSDIIDQVYALARGKTSVLVCMDSNHTHAHVSGELEAYAPLTTVGSYCVVFDTSIEDMPAEMFDQRDWGPGDNPKTAVRDYIQRHPEFQIDKRIPSKLLITTAPDGYLKRVK